MIRATMLAIEQRFARRKLARQPEMDMVMVDPEQDAEYTRDGEYGSLAIVYQIIAATLARTSPLEGSALDICCGSGQLLSRIASLMPKMHFTGLELAPEMLSYAAETIRKKSLSNVTLKKGNMYHLTEAFDQKFDLITWNLALHHCDTADSAVKVLNQVAALLKEGGTFFIYDINRPKSGSLALKLADYYNRTEGDWYYQDSLDSYKAAFTYAELAKILARSNLKGYRHIEPIFGNFFQIVLVSSTRNIKPPPVPRLRFLWQRLEYRTLCCFFGSRLP